MAAVFLGVGSNVNKEDNIQSGLRVLRETFAEVSCSPVYESEAIGFEGDNFLNLVVRVETDLAVGPLQALLRKIEDDHGRIRRCVRFSSRTLDIDILTYDDLVGLVDGVVLPREEILTNAFVLRPFAELAPSEKHPAMDQEYQRLWLGYSGDQHLWRVTLPSGE